MKKLIFLFAFMTLIIIGAFAVRASAGFETVITGKDGETRILQGIAEAGADDSGYEIRYNGKRIITVGQNIEETKNEGGFNLQSETLTHGYYSVEFEVSQAEGTSAFIAGLSKSNKDEVQAALITAAYRNELIDLESLDFIDTEKAKSQSVGDDMLCWAASAANVIHYTGWGRKAGFEDEDDLFEAFVDAFDNKAGHPYFGFMWFFNGINTAQNIDDKSHVKNYGETGGYLTDYYSTELIDYLDDPFKRIHRMTDHLRDGDGVSMAIVEYSNGQPTGGHALTVWGYIYDNRFESENDLEPEYLKALIISDSDSDRLGDERRSSPNKLHIMNTVPYNENGVKSWRADTYATGSKVINSFTILKAYSDDLKKETDPAATRNLFTTCDFSLIYFDMTVDGVDCGAFKEDDVIRFTPMINTISLTDFYGTLEWEVEINSQTYRQSETIPLNNELTILLAPIEISDLPAGEYEVTVTVNPGKSIEEAYYYNNSMTATFTIVDDCPDVSDARMTASISGQEGGFLHASFEYDKTDGIFDYMGDEYTTVIRASYYDSGSWSKWEDIVESYDCEGSFPAEGYFETKGTKVKFQAIAFGDEKPFLAVNSDEYDIEYIKLSLSAGENNTGVYSKLPSNACSLAAGEKFAFEVRDISTAASGNRSVELAIFAENMADPAEKTVLYYEVAAAPQKGESLTAREISSWSDEIKLCGRYKVYAAVFDETAGGIVEELGILEVKEPGSTEVNFNGDVCDDYDGLTSLREAVAACGVNDTVTVAGNIASVYVNEPIVIDKPVRIDFSCDNSYGVNVPGGTVLGTAVNGDLLYRLFDVVSGGELDGYGIIFKAGYAKSRGGGILIDGGNVKLEQCCFLACQSGRAGGGIYVKDGNLILNGCTFYYNTSGYGGALASSASGEVDALNCSFYGNESNGGAVYAGGRLSVISSNFVENKCGSTGGSGVTAERGADATLVNCVAPGDNTINENVKIYGCILGKTKYAGEVNGSKMNVSPGNVYRLSDGERAVYFSTGNGRGIPAMQYLSKTAEMPTSVKNIGGKIALYDGESAIVTDITSVFSDDELSKDCFGNPNEGFCGNINSKIAGTGMKLTKGGLMVTAYEGGDAAVVCAVYDNDGILIGFHPLADSIKNGSDVISLDEIQDSLNAGARRKFMLWDGLDTMRPLTKAGVN